MTREMASGGGSISDDPGSRHPAPELLDHFLDQAPGAGDPIVASHLSRCQSCAGILDDLRVVRRRLSEYSAVEVELPAHWDRLVQQTLTRARSDGRADAASTRFGQRQRWRPPWRPVLVAASLAGVAAIGIPAFLNQSQESQRVSAGPSPSTAVNSPPEASRTGAPTAAGGGPVVVTSDQAYTRENASTLVHRLMAGPPVVRTSTSGSRGDDGSRLAEKDPCPRPTSASRMLMVDHGSFEGRAAVVYIMGDSESSTVDVVFQLRDCRVITLSGL